MARRKIKTDWSSFEKGQFQVENNVWNKGDLQNGRDFIQSISFNPNDLTKKLVFAWDWPVADEVMAFPEIIAGYKPWSGQGSGAMTEKLSAIKKFTLSLDYEMFGDTDQFNVAVDMWFTNKPWSGGRNIRTEVKILTHEGEVGPPEGRLVAEYQKGDFAADIWVANGYSNNDGWNSWRYITVVSREDVTDIKLDVGDLLDTLVDLGYLNDKLYFNGYEFGAEVAGGKGRLEVDDIGHSISTRGGGAAQMQALDLSDMLV